MYLLYVNDSSSPFDCSKIFSTSSWLLFVVNEMLTYRVVYISKNKTITTARYLKVMSLFPVSVFFPVNWPRTARLEAMLRQEPVETPMPIRKGKKDINKNELHNRFIMRRSFAKNKSELK